MLEDIVANRPDSRDVAALKLWRRWASYRATRLPGGALIDEVLAPFPNNVEALLAQRGGRSERWASWTRPRRVRWPLRPTRGRRVAQMCFLGRIYEARHRDAGRDHGIWRRPQAQSAAWREPNWNSRRLYLAQNRLDDAEAFAEVCGAPAFQVGGCLPHLRPRQHHEEERRRCRATARAARQGPCRSCRLIQVELGRAGTPEGQPGRRARRFRPRPRRRPGVD